MKKIYLPLLLLLSCASFGQVGINTELPAATLDIVAQNSDGSGPITTPEGVLVPRLSRLRAQNMLGVKESTLIYVNDITNGSLTGKTELVNTIGFYYFSESANKWVKLSSGFAPGSSTNYDHQNGITETSGLVKLGGDLIENTSINQLDKTLNFTSTATTGTSHFTVDGTTLNVNAVANRVGIRTNVPSEALDINGKLRVRTVDVSTNTKDGNLVVDGNGVVKKSIKTSRGVFRGYLTNNFSSSSSSGIYKVTSNFRVIDNPNNDWNNSTKVFTAPVTGFYKITQTVTLAYSGSVANLVYGLVNRSNVKWITRNSISVSSLFRTSSTTGTTSTSVNLVRLTANQSVYFGLSSGGKIIANPTGGTGTGIGTYFEIELINNQ